MKTFTSIVIVSIIFAGTVFAQPADPATSNEFAAALQYFVPRDDENYDQGFGAEIQIRSWQSGCVGYALVVGHADWDINEEEMVISDEMGTFGASIEGSVRLIPVGGSILYRPPLPANFGLTLEGGVRYVIADSDADITAVVTDASGRAEATARLNIDDGVVGVIAASVDMAVSPRFDLLVGLGYQFDISKGDAEWMGEDFGDNELDAFFAQAGLLLEF